MQPVEYGIGDRVFGGKSVQVLFILNAFLLPQMLMIDSLLSVASCVLGREEETLWRFSLNLEIPVTVSCNK